MHALDMLIKYEFARQALVAGVAVGTLCSLLSVVVVLKRMAFIGQGISHAGFGGVGTAVILGLGGLSMDLTIFAFCLATALAIGVLSRRRHLEPDSAIGILLVATMAWGVLMTQLRVSMQQWPWYVKTFGAGVNRVSYELLLSGTLLSISPAQMWLAVVLSALVLIVAALLFKEILFFAFDEPVSRVFGVPTRFIYYLLLVLLAVTTVLSIRLVGFVLVTALLVIPGATALMLSRRLNWVLLWAWVVGLTGVVAGLLASLQIGDVSAGPCIVAVLCLLFGVTFAARHLRQRLAQGKTGVAGV